MNIVISNSGDDPLYIQIKNQIKEQILLGELKEKTALPSIRKLAKELQISVITTKKLTKSLKKRDLSKHFQAKGHLLLRKIKSF